MAEEMDRYLIETEITMAAGELKYIIPAWTLVAANRIDTGNVLIRVRVVEPSPQNREVGANERILPKDHEISISVAEWASTRRTRINDEPIPTMP